MLHLQQSGCHNFNLVTPTHVVPQILKALDIAIDQGLNIPLVYNCSGYESVETIKILDHIIDIYMPDFKFWDSDISKKYCNAKDYPESARKAVKLMHEQAGDLKTDDKGIACSGLLVRHLVMPESLDQTKSILTFLKEKISPGTSVNIMPQYRPMGEAGKIKALSRMLTPEEFVEAVNMGMELGLNIIR